MEKVIAYPSNDTVAIVYPIADCGIPLEEICKKDVPDGVPYKIIDRSLVPDDQMIFRDAWQMDFSNPDGYGMGPQKWFIEQYTKELLSIQSEKPPEDFSLLDAWEQSKLKRSNKCNQMIALMNEELSRGL